MSEFFNVFELPPDARVLVASIESRLIEAEALIEGASGDAAFALKEMRRSYLPQTIDSYLAVPPSLRRLPDDKGESAASQLIDMLQTLERASFDQLKILTSAQRKEMLIQKNFLGERFSHLSGIRHAENTATVDSDALGEQIETPSAMIHVILQGAHKKSNADPRELIESLAARFAESFPALTRVERTFLRRTIKQLRIEIPEAKTAMCYSLSLSEYGLEAVCARVVHRVTVKRDILAVDAWFTALGESLTAYCEADHMANERLRGLFR